MPIFVKTSAGLKKISKMFTKKDGALVSIGNAYVKSIGIASKVYSNFKIPVDTPWEPLADTGLFLEGGRASIDNDIAYAFGLTVTGQTVNGTETIPQDMVAYFQKSTQYWSWLNYTGTTKVKNGGTFFLPNPSNASLPKILYLYGTGIESGALNIQKITPNTSNPGSGTITSVDYAIDYNDAQGSGTALPAPDGWMFEKDGSIYCNLNTIPARVARITLDQNGAPASVATVVVDSRFTKKFTAAIGSDDGVYLFGGEDIATGGQPNQWVFCNIDTGEFRSGVMPHAVSELAIAREGDFIYLIGGVMVTDDGAGNIVRNPQSHSWVFHMPTEIFYVLSPMPDPAASRSVLFVMDGYLYCSGGDRHSTEPASTSMKVNRRAIS